MIGIDGCRAGWCIAFGEVFPEIVLIDHISKFDRYRKFEEFALIDIPIGLPDAFHPRRVESSARKMIINRASTVFNVPCRDAIYCQSFEDANAKNREILKKGVSIQSWNICKKIKEVDLFLRNEEIREWQLLESHPEVCFQVLSGGNDALPPKKTAEGKQFRLQLLDQYVRGIANLFTDSRSAFLKKHVNDDDIIDALCLWTTGLLSARYGMLNVCESQYDRFGLEMNMYYPRTTGEQ